MMKKGNISIRHFNVHWPGIVLICLYLCVCLCLFTLSSARADSLSPNEKSQLFQVYATDQLKEAFRRISLTFDDLSHDDMVLRRDGNKTYLYVGMKREGKNYYTFDVSNKLEPKLVFSIKGGDGEYARLAQTWSRPTITQIRIGTTVMDVMIIGGGYDVSQDDKVIRSVDSTGNAIFIIDANTGIKLYEITSDDADLKISEMQYSITGRISTIDRDADGLADHLYAADLGGQIFRIDIYNGETENNVIKGGLLADFNGDTKTTNRRFYYGPDVTEVVTVNEPYFAVAIGSGFRDGPVNSNVQDSFYMLKDQGVYSKDDNGHFTFPNGTYTVKDLYDATNHQLTSGDIILKTTAYSDLNMLAGWRIDLQACGEKVLISPLILNYQILFTTYSPASDNLANCSFTADTEQAYLVDLLTGNAVVDLDQDMLITRADRAVKLHQTKIASAPTIVIKNLVKPVVCVGSDCASAVIEFDANGNEIPCKNDFACLVQNIFGRFERIQPLSWKTEIEIKP